MGCVLDGVNEFSIRKGEFAALLRGVRSYVVSDVGGRPLLYASRPANEFFAVTVFVGVGILFNLLAHFLPMNDQGLLPFIMPLLLVSVMFYSFRKSKITVATRIDGTDATFSLAPEDSFLMLRNRYVVIDQSGMRIGSVALVSNLKHLSGVWQVKDAGGRQILVAKSVLFAFRNTIYDLMDGQEKTALGKVDTTFFEGRYSVSLSDGPNCDVDRRLVAGLALLMFDYTKRKRR